MKKIPKIRIVKEEDNEEEEIEYEIIPKGMSCFEYLSKKYVENFILIPSKIKEMVKNNDYLNGKVEIKNGDLLLADETKEMFLNLANNPIRVDDMTDLYNKLREDENIIVVFNNLVFIKHYAYGIFVYSLKNVKNYIEHLDNDIEIFDFLELVDKLVGKYE